MTVNVSDWRREPEWEFKFDELIEGEEFLKRSKEFAHPETLVSITDLYPGVASRVQSGKLYTRLKEKLAVKHQDSLKQGTSDYRKSRPAKICACDPTPIKTHTNPPYLDRTRKTGIQTHISSAEV